MLQTEPRYLIITIAIFQAFMIKQIMLVVIDVVLCPVTQIKTERILLKWKDSLKKFGYIFNAVFFHVPPPTSLEFFYSLFLWCCCFYISFFQKPVWITADPIAIIQYPEEGIFQHQSTQKTSRNQACCLCCTLRSSHNPIKWE